MRCTCSTWIEKIKKGERIHFRGVEITYCPFCELKLIDDDFRVHITYDGQESKSKEESIKILLVAYDVKKAPGKKKLYFDLQP